MSYQSINPNDGKTLKSFEHLSKAQLEKSLATAESCFQTWKHTSYSERAAIVS
jgi:succinate-semialdehyde dehydrogenase/glutarate-semialdehyde dehydrogenase